MGYKTDKTSKIIGQGVVELYSYAYTERTHVFIYLYTKRTDVPMYQTLL